jgi:hypothetical protein
MSDLTGRTSYTSLEEFFAEPVETAELICEHGDCLNFATDSTDKGDEVFVCDEHRPVVEVQG